MTLVDLNALWDALPPITKALYAEYGVTGPEGLALALGCLYDAMAALTEEPLKFFEAYRHVTNLLPKHEKLRIMGQHISLLQAAPEMPDSSVLPGVEPEPDSCSEPLSITTGNSSKME